MKLTTSIKEERYRCLVGFFYDIAFFVVCEVVNLTGDVDKKLELAKHIVYRIVLQHSGKYLRYVKHIETIRFPLIRVNESVT